MTGIFLAAFSYVAALMGAGFASGQETVMFFAVFGRAGAVGIVAAAAMIAAFGGLVSEYALRHNCGYSEIAGTVFPGGVRAAVDVLMLVFAVCVEAVMFACFGEIISSFTGLPVLVGAVGAAAAIGAAVYFGQRETLMLNAIIGAVMFIAASVVCLYLLGYREHQAFNGTEAVVSGVTYAGYNLLSVGAVLTSGRIFLKRRGDGFLCGIAAGLMIFILMLLMWGIIGIYYGKIDLGELPMITLAARESGTLAAVYAAVTAAAVLTTALSNSMCIVQSTEGIIGRGRAAVFGIGAGLALSGAGFSRLIDTAYRYCGIAGIFVAAWMIISLLIMMQKKKNGDLERKIK